METVTLKARAKINLTLDVTGKRPDGYHDVDMIMQQIDLYDVVTVSKSHATVPSEGTVGNFLIELTTNTRWLPIDGSNIAYKAAFLLNQTYNLSGGVRIHIEKNIPVAAGLAGGSTDAAAVIKAMNILYDLNLSLETMMELGLKLGADVPFCLLGGAARARGIGEDLEPVQGLQNIWVVLSKPTVGVSTKDVYGNLNLSTLKCHPDTNGMIEALEVQSFTKISDQLCNVLEEVTIPRYPIVREVKTHMKEYGAKKPLMSGSGPTVFALFKDSSKAQSVYKNMVRRYTQTYMVKSFDGGTGL